MKKLHDIVILFNAQYNAFVVNLIPGMRSRWTTLILPSN